ncbi:MAG: hypothetical protein WC792_01315 [Candidatus Micrarchaeia archaeon]|jgi:TRAP-type C4-dicarboxylate transport system permease small subunit
MRHFGKALDYYKHSLSHRRQWTDVWYRLLVVGVLGFALYVAWDYLDRAYLGQWVFAVTGKAEPLYLPLSQLLFGWFVLGLVVGAAFIVIVSEGEILLGFRKIARATGETGGLLEGELPGKTPGAKPPAGKKRR